MTQQFFAYLFQGLFIAIFDQIDVAFGNSISIDSIVALSTYTVITWIIHNIAQLGIHTYRMWLNRVRTCEMVSMVTSILIGIIVFFGSDFIVHLWYLTDIQYALCSACLRIYAISLPIIQFGDFLDEYLLFKQKIKELMFGNTLFYACLILTDLWCVKYHKPLYWLIVCTVISYLLYDIYLFFISGIRQEKEPIIISDVKQCIKHGCNILFDKLTGKVATIYYGIFASNLGTQLYAIHSVCYAVSVFGENFTDSFNTFQIVRQKKVEEKKRYHMKQLLLKKYGWKLTFIYIIGVLPVTYLIKGDIPFICVIGWVWLYCSDYISLLFYESNKAYLQAQEASKYLKYGGLVGGMTRILYVTVGYFLCLGLFPFATACAVDFAVRAIYYRYSVKQIEKSFNQTMSS